MNRRKEEEGVLHFGALISLSSSLQTAIIIVVTKRKWMRIRNPKGTIPFPTSSRTRGWWFSMKKNRKNL
jgi:hypothetical protein